MEAVATMFGGEWTVVAIQGFGTLLAALAAWAAWKAASASAASVTAAQRSLSREEAMRCAEMHIRTMEQLGKVYTALAALWALTKEDIAWDLQNSDDRVLRARMELRAAASPVDADIPKTIDLFNAQRDEIHHQANEALEEIDFEVQRLRVELAEDRPRTRHKAMEQTIRITTER